MIFSRLRAFPALMLGATSMLSACGSDSTSPSSIDSNTALQSLSLGLRGVLLGGFAKTPELNKSFGGIAPLLDQVTVNIDGVSQGMFALGVRITFPPGTCEENLFVGFFPPVPGHCTPPQLGLAVLLWQAHSASQRPDRMVVIVGEVGAINFDFASVPVGATLGEAMYMEGMENFWFSNSGTLATQVTGSGQTCSLQLPPYAKSATCSIATFNAQGSIVFGSVSANGPGTQRTTITIPPITLHGLWLAITEVQAMPITANRLGTALGVPGWPNIRPLTANAALRPARSTVP